LIPSEIILVDDASPDEGQTRKAIENIISMNSENKNVKINYIYLERNHGPGGARNAGWDIASGLYVAFLDADDFWAEDKIFIQYHWMLKNPEIILSCHETRDEKESADIVSQSLVTHIEINCYKLVFKNNISTRSVMMINNKNWRFPSSMKYAEDYYLWLYMALLGTRLVKLNLVLAFSNNCENKQNLSNNIKEMHLGVLKCYLDIRSKKLINSAVYFMAIFFEKIKYIKRILSRKYSH
jgi:glycosyltransferase involved in cell wall biosynthesis